MIINLNYSKLKIDFLLSDIHANDNLKVHHFAKICHCAETKVVISFREMLI